MHDRLFLHACDETVLCPGPAGSAFQALRPSAALGACVERIYLCDEWIPPAAPIEERVLPDGAVHLMFTLGDAPVDLSRGEAGPACEAAGATCAPARVRMAGAIEGVSVRLRPGGVAALLGVPAGEIAGGSVALDDLWGTPAAEALERLAEAPRAARATRVEAILLDALGRGRDPRPSACATEAVRRIQAAGGRIRVRELAAGLGVGERRLEQLFYRHVGLTPKAACRIARFHASLALLRARPEASWPDVAYRCGYSDQSHLIHDFRAMAGLTPGELKEFGFLQYTPAALP